MGSRSLAASDSVNGNWTYSYDQFNRLVGANKNSGQEVYTYVYDRFGNRWQQNGPHSMLLTFSGNNNRVDGYSYDAAGNPLNDGTHTYTYDAENRLAKVDGGNSATYVYDADGARAVKTNSSPINSGSNAPDPAGTIEFLYDLSNRLIATEAPNGGTAWVLEAYAGSRHLASYIGNVAITHSDWLGTERHRDFLNLPYNPNQLYTQTFATLPFGDWGLSITADWDPLNFTGQYHDFESNLDNFGARYYSSSMGRFMRPDPSNVNPDIVDSENPQAWNMYSYVLNNPLNAVDPDGLDYYLLGGDQCGQKVQCDDKGHVLDSNGKAVVITDEQIANSNGLAKIDENGNLQIKTDQGTFQGEFFDPKPFSVTVTPSFEEQKFMALQDAGAMATPGVNAAMAITAPQLIFMGGATVALSGAGSTLTLEAGEIAASPGEVAELSQAATQGGKAAVKKALRSYAKRLAQHQADLAKYQSQGGYTSKTVGEIKHFQTMIRLAEDWLLKNP